MQIDDRNNLISLFDIYGQLLSQKEYKVMETFLNDDLSETEIAEIFNETRQSVYDAVKKAKEKLESFEQKCGVKKTQNCTKNFLKHIKKLINEGNFDSALSEIDEIITKI